MSEEPDPEDAALRSLGIPEALAHRWRSASETRARVLAILIADPLMLEAFEEIETLLKAFERATSTLRDPTVGQLFVRLRFDFEDAVEGMLERRGARLLDPARDLMELAALMRDFRHQPQRFAKWKKISEEERPREFGFNKLLRKYPDSPFEWIGDDPAEVLREYTLHSRTLHPAFPLTDGSELTRGIDELTEWLPTRVSFDAVEIIRHTMCAISEGLKWLAASEPELDLGDDAGPLQADSATRRRVSDHYRWLNENMSDDFVEQFEEKYNQYSPKRSRSAFGSAADASTASADDPHDPGR